MDWHNYHSVTGTSIKSTNVKSSNGINFLSDDMETIKENDKWRSSVQKALDKLSAKTNVTTSDGTTIR
jgi:ribosomal protein S3AE